MLKLIFLDIDGVLNNNKTFERLQDYNRKDLLDDQLIEKLNSLTDTINAKIVISSTWRFCHCKELLESSIAGKIIGRTPCLHTKRGEEIKAYLDTIIEDVSYVILDDDIDMLEEQLPYFIQTTNALGLEDKHIDKAMDIFSPYLEPWEKIKLHCANVDYAKCEKGECKYSDIACNCIFAKEYLPTMPIFWVDENIDKYKQEIINILKTRAL